MPWHGKSRWSVRHPKWLIDVFVAGMIVFMGIQASTNAGPVLKPHRLERSHLPDQTKVPTPDPAGGCSAEATLPTYCHASGIDFAVSAFLSFTALEAVYTKAQIGSDSWQFAKRTSRILGMVSPRGPPSTVS